MRGFSHTKAIEIFLVREKPGQKLYYNHIAAGVLSNRHIFLKLQRFRCRYAVAGVQGGMDETQQISQ
jgi:hypothetical protein